jgi:hypothetical protein
MPFPLIFILYIDVNYIIEDTKQSCQGKDVQDSFIKRDAAAKPFASCFMNVSRMWTITSPVHKYQVLG